MKYHNPHPPHLGDLLLASGAVEGPARRAKPLTLSLWTRLRRAVRAWAINWRTK